MVTLALTLASIFAGRSWLENRQPDRTDPPAVAVAAGSSPSAVAAPTPSQATPAALQVWWSGVGGEDHSAADGRWGSWRGEAVTVGGTWDNGNQEMLQMRSICGNGMWATWTKPLDVAVGAIEVDRGDTWAKAARGAYDARWRANLKRIKTCWGSRDPSLLYIRFAHEMNLSDMPWRVKGGQEADFVKAITRYSNLRYQIIPKAKLVLCPSDGTSGGIGTNIRKLWPGKDATGRQVVQVYSVDSYNSWVVIRNRPEFQAKLFAEQSGQPLGLEQHRALAQEWGVPFAVSEWAGNGDPKDVGKGDDLPVYYDLMNEWFRTYAADPKNPQPGQLLYEVYFNDQDRFTLLPTKYQPKSAARYRSLTWGR